MCHKSQDSGELQYNSTKWKEQFDPALSRFEEELWVRELWVRVQVLGLMVSDFRVGILGFVLGFVLVFVLGFGLGAWVATENPLYLRWYSESPQTHRAFGETTTS